MLIAAIYMVCYSASGCRRWWQGPRHAIRAVPTPVGDGIVLAVPAALAIPATLQATVRTTGSGADSGQEPRWIRWAGAHRQPHDLTVCGRGGAASLGATADRLKSPATPSSSGCRPWWSTRRRALAAPPGGWLARRGAGLGGRARRPRVGGRGHARPAPGHRPAATVAGRGDPSALDSAGRAGRRPCGSAGSASTGPTVCGRTALPPSSSAGSPADLPSGAAAEEFLRLDDALDVIAVHFAGEHPPHVPAWLFGTRA